tara:strand:+ start:647 stop:1210 length:564 start_codon:yes stop_codon:yes gene_type:complete
MNGGFETTGTVKSVQIEYDAEKQWGTYNPTFDMFLTIEYNDGQDWDKTLTIHGNVKKNLPITDPKSWGAGFKVRTFFEAALNKKNLLMNDDYTLPESWLDDVVGKQFMVCSYKTNKMKKTGKNFWNTYQIVAPAGSPAGTLKNKVIKDVQDGWIKDAAEDDSSPSSTAPSTPPPTVTPTNVDTSFDI